MAPLRLIAAAVAALLVLAAAGQAGEPFSLDLVDQYGDPVRVSPAARGDGRPVTLVVIADRRGSDGRQAWANALRAQYADPLDRRPEPALVVIRVAHLAGIPKPFRGRLVDRFFAGEPPVALDWEGQAAGQLQFAPGVPNLVLLDRTGGVVLTLAGAPEKKNRERLFAEIDRLLSSAPMPPYLERPSGPSR